MPPVPSLAAIRQLAPGQTLRAALNTRNDLLNSRICASGVILGLAPDLAKVLANFLGVSLAIIPFPNRWEIANVTEGCGTWDVGFVVSDPSRACHLRCTKAYVETGATYLVPSYSNFRRSADVDSAGVRIASSRYSACDLWLSRNLRQSRLVRTATPDEALGVLAGGGADALAGNRSQLTEVARVMRGFARVLPDDFMLTQQTICTMKANADGAEYLEDFVQYIKKSGLVPSLIKKYEIKDLSAARLT